MVTLELVAVIRHKVLTEGVPIREVMRQFGLSRTTIRRDVRAKAVPLPRPARTRAAPVRSAVIEEARAIWKDRRTFTAGTQRLTATRLTALLRERGHTVRGRTVRRLVGEFLRLDKEVTVPLIYQPGEAAQVDFVEVWIELAAVRIRAWMFLLRLMFSGRDFARVCARQDTTWFLTAHNAAFAHLKGVMAAAIDDNLTAAVARILRGEPRALRPRCAAFAAHDAIEPRFCRPGEGHDTGGVERRGGHVRHQHRVPIPRGDTFGAINQALQARLDAQFFAAPRRADAWSREAAARRALPVETFDPSEIRSVQLRQHASHGLGGANYSVPSRGCGHAVEVRVGTETGVFAHGTEVVTHPRKPLGGRRVDYRHLLLPLSTKPQALRQVVRERIAQFGEPWPTLWSALCAHHSPDAIEAARRLAPWLRQADREGLAATSRQIAASLTTGTLLPEMATKAVSTTTLTVPAALRDYVVETPDLTRYDVLGKPAKEVA